MDKSNFKTDDIDIKIKEYVMEYIYSKINLQDYKFTIIKNDDNMTMQNNDILLNLKKTSHYISANYGGITSLLIFLKINDKFHSYLIDRRSISFNKHFNNRNNNILNVRMTKIYASVNMDFYDGSIFDCYLIDRPIKHNNPHNNNNNNNNNNNYKSKNITMNNINKKQQILITDIFYMCGKNLLMMDYKEKIYSTTIFLNSYYNYNCNDNIQLYITPVYELNQIKELFTNYIKHNTQLLNIKGIVFYKKQSSVKIIYIYQPQDNIYKEELYDEEKDLTVEQKNSNNVVFDTDVITQTNLKKKIKFELSDISNNEEIKLNFEVVKHVATSDIYNLYGLYLSNNKVYKKNSGIAYIPNYNTSVNCKNMFNDSNSNTLIMECLFVPSRGKWIPLKISKIEKLHIISMDNRLKISDDIEKKYD